MLITGCLITSRRMLRLVEEYNNQPAEIDANAFAAAIMSDAFGIAPQFNTLSDSTKARIFQRANEVSKEL